MNQIPKSICRCKGCRAHFAAYLKYMVTDDKASWDCGYEVGKDIGLEEFGDKLLRRD